MNLEKILKPKEVDRLKQIRADSRKWVRERPEAYYWNDGFLLRIINKLVRRLK